MANKSRTAPSVILTGNNTRKIRWSWKSLFHWLVIPESGDWPHSKIVGVTFDEHSIPRRVERTLEIEDGIWHSSGEYGFLLAPWNHWELCLGNHDPSSTVVAPILGMEVGRCVDTQSFCLIVLGPVFLRALMKGWHFAASVLKDWKGQSIHVTDHRELTCPSSMKIPPPFRCSSPSLGRPCELWVLVDMP